MPAADPGNCPHCGQKWVPRRKKSAGAFSCFALRALEIGFSGLPFPRPLWALGSAASHSRGRYGVPSASPGWAQTALQCGTGASTDLSLPAGAGCFQRRPFQLPLVVGVHDSLEGLDGVEQIAVMLHPVFRHHRGTLGLDKSFGFKRRNVFCHSVFAHAHRFANRFVARPALMGLVVFTVEQESIDRQLARAEAENKNFIGNGKGTLRGTVLVPLTQPLSPPFV